MSNIFGLLKDCIETNPFNGGAASRDSYTCKKPCRTFSLHVMAAIPYQIAVLGENSSANQSAFKVDVLNRIAELGVDTHSHVKFLDADNIGSYSKAAPLVAVFFGGSSLPAVQTEAVRKVVDDGFIVIPVVNSLDNYSDQVPECLIPINGMELKDSSGGITAITSATLEVLNLLRQTRKLFISYRRLESRSIAIQLYEHLDCCGFDVFLDTVSIRPGDPFQEVLWHKLSDTDVVVLLDTPGFLSSRWTSEELAKASSMSIGIIQIIWPNHKPDPASSLCERFYLQEGDISTNAENTLSLSDTVVGEITKISESLRARSLSARYQNLVGELRSVASDLNMVVTLQPNQYVLVDTGSKKVAAIPTVGVPEALKYQEVGEILNAISGSVAKEAVLLYDGNNIRKRWYEHLHWLDSHLPVKSVRITNARQWLSSL